MEKRKYLLLPVLAAVVFFLNNSLSAQEQLSAREEAVYFYSVESPLQLLPLEPSFTKSFRKEIRFYPPVDTEEFSYLQICLSEGISEDFTLLLNDREISVKLPSFTRDLPVYIQLPGNVYLQGLLVSGRSSISRDSLFFRTSTPSAGFLQITSEDPETLEFHLPRGDRDGQSFYLLKIFNRGTLTIEGVNSVDLRLKPYKLPQPVSLYPGKNSLETWKLSPLSKIESIACRKETVPAFPIPLTEGMNGVLNRSQVDWRHPEFELFRWVRFPDILVWDCRDYDIQNRFFRRLSYYVEKKGFRGSLLTEQELEGKHGWNAHDYRAADLADFFNKARSTEFPLFEEELLMLDVLLKEKILSEDSEGILQPNKGAVISISRESIPILRERFLVHEASHGLYFTTSEYREYIHSLWEGLQDDDRQLWRFFLGWYGYDPTDEDLMINEFQAYLVQQKSDQAAGFFDYRLTKLIPQYPEQKGLLERGTGENSALFNLWAGLIKHWMIEEWGLEPGDFFPLYKELQ